MNEIHTKNRNVIKKGEKNGLEFIVDDDFIYLDEFKELYDSTMDKLDADGFYYFAPKYYNQLKDTIENSFLGIVKHEGKVVAGAIFFYQLPYGHIILLGVTRLLLNFHLTTFSIGKPLRNLLIEG